MAVFTQGDVPWNSLDDKIRLPTTGELEAGYPCGAADQQLFNFTTAYAWGQVHNAIQQAGLTVDIRDLTQLTLAIQELSKPKGMTVYSTPGSHTFTVPDGVRKIFCKVYGGGGGGGGGASSNINWAGVGGAGGGYTEGYIDVIPGDSISIVVGGGGSGGSSGGNGSQGGDSSVGVDLFAYGGSGGNYQQSSDTFQSIGGGYLGGNGYNGGGGDIVKSAPSPLAIGGAGGNCGGDGGQGGVSTSTTPGPAVAPGGGGGGAAGAGGVSGANGAPGRVVIFY